MINRDLLALRRQLDKEWDDGPTRLLYADCFEEQGDEYADDAAVQRALARAVIDGAGLEFDVECLPEETDPADHFEDMDDLAFVVAGIDGGNPWAWCTVRVVVRLDGYPQYEGDAYLGGCSYANAAEFIQSGNYESMQHLALGNLIQTIEHDWAMDVLETT